MRVYQLFAAFAAIVSAVTAATIQVSPTDSLASVQEKLASDPGITEVVFATGMYIGGLHLREPRQPNGQRNLLLRPADGASVIFDGSRPVQNFRAESDPAGLFSIDYRDRGGEAPKLWEPRTRIRYLLVADRESVRRFPGSFTVEKERLLFHTSDGQVPTPGGLLMSGEDCGMFVNRSNVTVRGIAFQNYLAREKWSTGIDLRSHNIKVEDCAATNCSLGFIVNGKDNQVRGCSADDVGGGVYVGGENAAVGNCRLFKRRDTFMVPMYAQDDTGIQYYAPAKGGLVRGNLCVGYGMGVFIKASTAPYIVEHNTLVGRGQGLGFGSTSWHPGQRFRYNIVADCDRPVQIFTDDQRDRRDIDFNCYWTAGRNDIKPIGRNDIVADPKFVWPQWNDYRLRTNSPCLKLANASGPWGAFEWAPDDDGVSNAGREWHVSESGRDGNSGTAEQPVRTIQFAIDRVRPGDTVLVHPGLYADPVRILRGGTAERPIVLRAVQQWEAILDCNRSASVMVLVERAPFVQIHGFEIRWYRDIAIQLEESPDVTVTGCRVWNAHWNGAWPTGTAIRATKSPRFTGRHNVLFRQEHAFWLYNSPAAVLTQNTCVANLYSAAAFLYSCENSVCRDNNFTFQGNDVLVIEENLGGKGKLKSFQCDYNNYGTALREQPAGTKFDSIKPRKNEGFLSAGSKAIVNYSEYKGSGKRFVSMDEWREFSGLDSHTIFADPLFRDVAARDFRLEEKSPNRGAGTDKTVIGALAE